VEFRLRVAESLWYVDHDSQTITPILVAVLSNRNDPYRPKAAALLGLMGPGAAAAVPTLKSVTNEDFSYTRVKAEEALSLIGKSVEVPAPHSPGSP
jgi:HEAT repeat protein